MPDEPEVVGGEVTDSGPVPELAPAVDEKLPPMELAVSDPSDPYELMVRMDAHDVQMLLQEVQTAALRKWVYKFDSADGEKLGLTVHAVQDIVQRMNWTGKAKIGLLSDVNGVPVVQVETIMEDTGKGEEPMYEATVYAKDELTGMVQSGSSTEPKWMRLRSGKTRFDIFARTKAINKAERNAMAKFIPEEIEQTVIAMFSNDPSRVERIRSEAEVRMADMPPPLDDDEALALIAQAEAIYARIRELGGGRGKIEVTPGAFAAFKINAQHSHDRLRDMIVWLEQRETEIAAKFEAAS